MQQMRGNKVMKRKSKDWDQVEGASRIFKTIQVECSKRHKKDTYLKQCWSSRIRYKGTMQGLETG